MAVAASRSASTGGQKERREELQGKSMEVTSAAGQEVCEVAARNGQLDIVKLLFERRDEGKLRSYFAAFTYIIIVICIYLLYLLIQIKSKIKSSKI